MTVNPDYPHVRPEEVGRLESEYLRSGPKELCEHPGKWVMIVGKEIVATASDEDFDKAFDEVERKYPGKPPLVIKVPKEKVMLF